MAVSSGNTVKLYDNRNTSDSNSGWVNSALVYAIPVLCLISRFFPVVPPPLTRSFPLRLIKRRATFGP